MKIPSVEFGVFFFGGGIRGSFFQSVAQQDTITLTVMWKNNTGSRAPVGLWEHDNTTLKLVGAMSIMLVSGRGGGYKCGYLCTSKKKIASITWPFLDGWSTLRSSGHALYTSSWTASKVRRCWNEQLVKSAQLKNEPRGPKRRVYQANFQGRFVGLRDGMYFSNVLESNELGIIHQELVIKHEFLSLMNQVLKDAPMHHCQISKIWLSGLWVKFVAIEEGLNKKSWFYFRSFKISSTQKQFTKGFRNRP